MFILSLGLGYAFGLFDTLPKLGYRLEQWGVPWSSGRC